jgi:FkbM family methyltransferase
MILGASMANKYSLNQIKYRFFAFLYGSANRQKRLEGKIKKLQRYLGIGSGGNIENSGEAKIIKMLKKEKSSNLCIFDVGANKGDFAKIALSILRGEDKLTIHCFEPSKYTYNLLKQNLTGNTQVILNNIGFGKEQGEFNLYYDEPGSGTASLTKRNLDYMGVEFKHCERVPIDTVDHYCEVKNIGFIDLLKIDVEGHELDVLDGAGSMLRKKAIGKVSFEFGGCNIDTRTFFKDFFCYFQKQHYRLYRITPSGYFFPVDSYKETYEQFRTTNFLAILRDN